MSLTEPKCHVLELFQCSAGEELSANQFAFLKNWKSLLHSPTIPYFLNEKISKPRHRLEQQVFLVNILQDYDLWCSKSSPVFE